MRTERERSQEQQAILSQLDPKRNADFLAVDHVTKWVYWKTQERGKPKEAAKALTDWKVKDSIFSRSKAKGDQGDEYARKRDLLLGYIFQDDPNKDPNDFVGEDRKRLEIYDKLLELIH